MIGSSNAVIKTGGGAPSIFNTVIDQDTTPAMSMPSFEQSWWEANYIDWDSPDIPTDFTVTENVSSLEGAFGGSQLKTVNLSGGGENLSTMSDMFRQNTQLESVDFSDLDAHNVSNTSGLFQGCSSLVSVSGLSVSSVTNAAQTFASCSSIKSVPYIDISKAVSVVGMFWGCAQLEALPDLDTSSAVDANEMFYNCSKLEHIPPLDFSVATYPDYCFHGCSSLLEAPKITMLKAVSVVGYFQGCSSMVSADCSGWNTSATTVMREFFSECTSLKYANLSGWTTESMADNYYLFGSCSSLIAVVIDSPTLFRLTSSHTFDNSSITNGGTGFVYVPDNLVDEYKSATNWTTVADQIKPLSELPQEVKDVFGME